MGIRLYLGSAVSYPQISIYLEVLFMKAMIIETYGKVPLRLADMPLPEIGEHDVLAEIHAASINPIDFKIRDGKVKLLLQYKMPLILGNDFSGGVDTFAIQLAKYMDAVVATTTSEAGTALITSLGADTIINYKTERFEEMLQEYDAVFDTIGGKTLGPTSAAWRRLFHSCVAA
jgi:NADPH:quinone reductase-like Zn-dependent oxidoreductase